MEGMLDSIATVTATINEAIPSKVTLGIVIG
jgi:hypothetical protein